MILAWLCRFKYWFDKYFRNFIGGDSVLGGGVVCSYADILCAESAESWHNNCCSILFNFDGILTQKRFFCL